MILVVPYHELRVGTAYPLPLTWPEAEEGGTRAGWLIVFGSVGTVMLIRGRRTPWLLSAVYFDKT